MIGVSVLILVFHQVKDEVHVDGREEVVHSAPDRPLDLALLHAVAPPAVFLSATDGSVQPYGKFRVATQVVEQCSLRPSLYAFRVVPNLRVGYPFGQFGQVLQVLPILDGVGSKLFDQRVE